MNSDRMQKLEDIFHRARELDSETRKAYLARVCHDDESLQNEVVALLAQLDSQKPDKLVGPAVFNANVLTNTKASRDSLIGTQIGNYQITGRIGQGGFGTVYLASRIKEIEQTVAINT